MNLTSVLIEPSPILRPRARRRLRYGINEALPAFLIGLAMVLGPAILLLMKVPG